MLKERYDSLREFIEPTQPNHDGDMIDDEQWYSDGDRDWERDEDSDGVDDDDIEVRVKLSMA